MNPSHCAKHNTWPKPDEPCWQCIVEHVPPRQKDYEEFYDKIIELLPGEFRENSLGAVDCVRRLVAAYDEVLQVNHEFRHGHRAPSLESSEGYSPNACVIQETKESTEGHSPEAGLSQETKEHLGEQGAVEAKDPMN